MEHFILYIALSDAHSLFFICPLKGNLRRKFIHV